MIETIIRDLRFGARSLLRTPVLTGAAVLSIALGIAAATSVFSIVDAALFRPPPLERANDLAIVFITRQHPNEPAGRERWSWPRFRLLAGTSTSFEDVGTFSQAVVAITSGEPEPTNAEVVSSAYLSILRVRPILGRAFSAEEDARGAPPVTVLSYEIWQRRFGGEASVIGRAVSVNGVPLTIIGVLPRGFAGLTGRAQLWFPATTAPRLTYDKYLVTNQNFISVVARLRAGVTIDAARNELAIVGAGIHRAAPTETSVAGTRFAATALTLNDARVDPTTRKPMLLLLAGAACLLMLACANVAGLLLGRAASRRREIAIRIATGASSGRIVRQLLVESAMLAAVGGAFGVLVAMPVTMNVSLPSALWRGRNNYGALSEFSTPSIDLRVAAFSLVVCVITTLVFGLVPALQATRLELTGALKDGTGGAGRGGSSRFPLRRLVVGVETALAMLLLVAGALLAMSWRRLQTTDTGFDRSHLLTFQLRPSEIQYPVEKAPALLSRVLAEIERIPGVDAATVDGCAPVGAGCANSSLYVMGRPAPAPAEAPGVLRHYVAPSHFRTLGIPIIRGRTFNDGDRAGANRVTIINQLAAKRFWPNEDPMGKRVWFGGGSSFNSPDSSAEIVGIVGDVAYQSLDERPFQPDFYTPYAQFTYASRMVLVRTRGEPTAVVPDVRRALAAVDPSLALFDVRTMEDRAGDSWARLSYQTKVLGAFAVVAILLAATGIFAIVAHAIGDRRREIGIRVALGANPRQVLATVGANGARPAIIGLGVGTLLAFLVGRALTSVVYGVTPFDPMVIGSTLVVLLSVIIAAAYIAARKALTVDPVESLRLE